jgi:acetyltransferase-like isoleucine patch superfamily enzyme
MKIIGWLTHKIQVVRHKSWENSIKDSIANCGEGVYLNGYSNFIHPEKLILGNNVHIGKNGWFHCGGGIEIGDNTHISRNCVMFSSSHNYKGKRLPYDSTFIEKPVNIGGNVWIGMNVMIIPGTTIGDGAIIGLGTVVVKDVPPLAIVGSQEHRIIGWRDEEHYSSLENQAQYGGRGGASLDE